MGLVDWLMGRRGASFEWVARPGKDLVVDLDGGTFCGVKVGAPIAQLSFLGPSDEPRRQGGILNYRRKGFYLVHDEGRLETVVVFLRVAGDGFQPYEGAWQCGGRRVSIREATTRDDVLELAGAPTWVEDDTTGEVVWYYPRGSAEWQAVWLPTGELESVELGEPESKDERYHRPFGEAGTRHGGSAPDDDADASA